jgi:hypothetical protein
MIEEKKDPVKTVKADPVKTAVSEIKSKPVNKKNVKKTLHKFARNVMKTLDGAKKEKKMWNKKVAKVAAKVNTMGRKGGSVNTVGRKGFYPPKMKTELYNLYQKNHSLKEDVLGKIKAKYPEAKNLNRNRAWSIIAAMMKKNGVVTKKAVAGKRGRPAGSVNKAKAHRIVRIVKHRDWAKMDEDEAGEPAAKTVNVFVGGFLFRVDHDRAKNILADLMDLSAPVNKWD